MARQTWTEDRIETELLAVVAALGRFPRRADLVERDLGGLWDAMRRRGGADTWRERLAGTGEERGETEAAAVPEAVAASEAVAVPEAAASPEAVPAAGAAPSLAAAPEAAPRREEIELAAYLLYASGHPGDAVDHWLTAERALAA